MTTDDHWVTWHAQYEDPHSSLNRRLAAVQRRLRNALDLAKPGPLRLLSLCAGQGRDVIEVLHGHPRSSDVRALLVELDPRHVRDARGRAAAAGLSTVTVLEADASTTSAYASAVPADLLLACGLFGNISDGDIRGTITHLSTLLAPHATVVWTRHRRARDLTPSVRRWFRDEGFEEIAFDSEEGTSYGVGAHRLVVEPQPYEPGRRLFTFYGDGSAAQH